MHIQTPNPSALADIAEYAVKNGLSYTTAGLVAAVRGMIFIRREIML